jgi:hypothetical protein
MRLAETGTKRWQCSTAGCFASFFEDASFWGLTWLIGLI